MKCGKKELECDVCEIFVVKKQLQREDNNSVKSSSNETCDSSKSYQETRSTTLQKKFLEENDQNYLKSELEVETMDCSNLQTAEFEDQELNQNVIKLDMQIYQIEEEMEGNNFLEGIIVRKQVEEV